MKAVAILSVPEANHRALELLRLLPGLLVILAIVAVLALESVDSGAEAPNRESASRVGSAGFGTASPPITAFYLVNSESQLDEIAASEAEIFGATSTNGQAD